MRFRSLLVGLTTFLLLPVVDARADSRFDGTWIGTETATLQMWTSDPKAKRPAPSSAKTTIIVAQGGKLVGKIGGVCPGRFEHVRWAGNSLNFDAHYCRLKVTLSPDGKTLTENGLIDQNTGYSYATGARPSYRTFQITGTFHRQ
jgi:hypothetical protein